mgnify:CR=1 FL=1
MSLRVFVRIHIVGAIDMKRIRSGCFSEAYSNEALAEITKHSQIG